MLRLSLLVLLSLGLIVMSGCSSRKYYEPQDVVGFWENSGYLDDSIVDVTPTGAMLSNQELLVRTGKIEITLPEDYRFVGESDGWIISVKVNGDLLLQSPDGTKEERFELRKTIAGASAQGNVLAVLFASDDMALYDIKTKELILKEEGSPPVIVDNRIVNPFFLNDLVLFPTLNGKIVVINARTKQILRSMLVSTDEYFNNVLFFKIMGNTMLSSTSTKVMAMAAKEIREKYDIRDIIATEQGIWISTKQGEIIALTHSLELKHKVKFPFAHFIGMILTDQHLYVIEKEGYLIKLDPELSTHSVYDADVDNGMVFVGDKAFYVGDRIISVK